MIEKDLELATGAVAKVWAPITSSFNHRSGEARVLVGCWISAEAYEAGKQPLETPRERVFSAEQIAAATGGADIDFSGLVLALLSPLPEFSAADPETAAD